MATKRNPGEFDCYAAADYDEPIFTLRAADPAAPMCVREWAYLRRKSIEAGKHPPEDIAKVDEAKNVADAMDAWRRKRKGRG